MRQMLPPGGRQSLATALYDESWGNHNVEARVHPSTYHHHVCIERQSYVQYKTTNQTHNNSVIRAQKVGFMFKVSLQSLRERSYFQQ